MGSSGDERRERLENARLYVVTDARRAKGDLPGFLDAILSSGCDIIQLREKDAEAGDIIRWARVFRQAADRYSALFMINDRADLALACEADGLHVGQNDLPVQWARRIVGPDLLLGLSCHSSQDHDTAPLETDYLTAGPIWATPTKPDREATGLDLVQRASLKLRKPWFAIGGIDQTNVKQVVRSGAKRIAVMRSVTDKDNPIAAVRALLTMLPGAGSQTRTT